MKCFSTIWTTLLILAVGANNASAAEKFSLNKDYTSIRFTVNYLLVLKVNGQFNDFMGSFVIDREHPEKSRADIIIQTASVETGIDLRDSEIRGPLLFNADRYPTMVFRSRKIEITSDNTGQITGDLTLLGITKPVTLNLVQSLGKDKNFVYGFKLTGQIKRSEFGMNAFMTIGNVVTLLVCYNVTDCAIEEAQQINAKSRYNR